MLDWALTCRVLLPVVAMIPLPMPSMGQGSATAAASVELAQPSVDFGRVRPGSSHVATFVLRNSGAAPVTVRAAVPSCKCTDVGLQPGAVIPAGGELSFVATLAVPTTPGDKDAKIQIVLDDGSAPLVAQMTSVAALPIASSPAFVDALKGKSSGTVTLTSEDGKPFSVLSADGSSPVFLGFDPTKDAPRAEYTVVWSFQAPPSGDPRLWWIVSTDRADAPLVALRVRHELTGSKADMARFERHWWMPEQLVLANRVKAGVPVTLAVDLEHYNPKGRGAVEKPEWSAVKSVQSLSASATATLLQAVPEGDHTKVTFSFTPGASTSGFIWVPVQITTATGSGVVPVAALVAP